MYKIFCILSFLIVCISCKKEIKNYNSSEIIRSNLDSINKAKSIHEKNDPIVSHEYKELLAKRVNHFINDTILQEFASKLKKTKHRDSNGNELVLEKYPKNIFHLNTSDSIFNDKLGKLSFDLPNEIYLQKGDSFRISTPKIYELFKKTNEINFHKIKDDSLDIYHSILMKNTKFTTYSLMFTTTVDCNSCEYGYRYAAKFIVSMDNSNNEVLDVARISFISGNDLGGDYKFYYHKNGNIYCIYFKYDEEGYTYINKENYKITDSGRIVNYYTKNGNYASDHEEGLVEDNTRSKKWIVKKDIGLFNSLNTYIEGNYEKGVKQGEFRYYMLKEKQDKKGKLIYTETYKDGVLQKRNFVD